MDDDLFDAARTIRPYLAELVGAEAASYDEQIAGLLAAAQAGTDVDEELSAVLQRSEAIHAWIAKTLEDELHRPPDLQPTRELGRQAIRGYPDRGVARGARRHRDLRRRRPALRLIEGYWPAPLDRIRRRRISAIRAEADRMAEQFQDLAGPVLGTRTATHDQNREFVKLDQQLRRLPTDGDYLPTRVGNILRAGERRPKEKYGLDAVVVWPRLWLLLPADTRTELAQARSSLDTAVGAVIWALLFLGFTFLAWWAVPIAVGIILVMILYWIPDRAEVFADLLEAAFDLHRVTIYEHLRWPLPANPHEERSCGEQLTSYLLRGLDSTVPAFTSPSGTAENQDH